MFRTIRERRRRKIESRLDAIDAYMADRRARLVAEYGLGQISHDMFVAQSVDLITEVSAAKMRLSRPRLFL